MNETFDNYWQTFSEKYIRLQMKSRMTHDDMQLLKQMRKEREELVTYITYRGFRVDENDNILRSDV